MTSESPADRAVALVPVAPAAIVRVLVRPLTKILNPLMVRLAGRRFFPMAQIHHVGRRSGKAYVTPTSAHLRGDMLLIALTFGNQSDWSRNVRAAGGASSGWAATSTVPPAPRSSPGPITGDWSRPRSTRCCGPDSACSAYSSSCACVRCSPVSPAGLSWPGRTRGPIPAVRAR